LFSARETPKLTGGAGFTVEIDDSKYGKRKYNKGEMVESQWVMGALVVKLVMFFGTVCQQSM